MACVIRLNSKKFISDFLKEFEQEKFQFILISEDITTKGKCSNVMPMTALLPPPNVLSLFIDDGKTKTYKKKYFEFLNKDDINFLVSTIVTGVMNNLNMVLLCSKDEDEYGYIGMICDFIEDKYKLKTYTYKEFKNNPDKAKKIKNRDQILKCLTDIKTSLNPSSNISPIINKDKFIKQLKSMEVSELKTFCKFKKIKIDDIKKKKHIIRQIVKKIL